MTQQQERLAEIMQVEIGQTYVYCLCHGWRRPNTTSELCPRIYATSEVEPAGRT